MYSDDEEVVPILYNGMLILEQDEAPKRKWWIRPYNQKRNEKDTIKNLILDLRIYPEKFRNYTRMQAGTFDYLLELVSDGICKQDTNFRKSIPPDERLFITLRYLASGETFKSLAYQFRCGSSTIESIVKETCAVIWDKLSPTYLPTPNAEKWTDIADTFQKLWNFPNCLGAIGGKYINYKKSHSIHLQAVVDAQGQFICIDVCDFERNSDSGEFKHSNFGKKLMANQLSLPHKQKLCPESDVFFPYVFVADEGYPLLTNVMRPFGKKKLTNERRIYNYRLFRARRTVECTFSILTKRFRVLENLILVSPNKVQTIILAVCALHNMIRKHENLLEDIFVERDIMEIENNKKINDSIQIARPSNAARSIRNQFVSYFNSATGSVPWQLKYAN